MEPEKDRERFQHLIETARLVQGKLLFLPTVAVGGTAAALYAKHRVSLDVDFVTPYLRDHFDEVEAALREIPDFTAARLRRPVLILGSVGNDEVGIRQLRRQEPLEAVEREGLWIPTLPEMIRVKSFVLSDRRAVRDFVDLCALVELAGWESAVNAMDSYARLYEGLTTGGAVPTLAEAIHDDPADLLDVNLEDWRLLKPEFRNLDRVRNVCETFVLRVIDRAAALRARHGG